MSAHACHDVLCYAEDGCDPLTIAPVLRNLGYEGNRRWKRTEGKNGHDTIE
jgi:hypothetical protein